MQFGIQQSHPAALFYTFFNMRWSLRSLLSPNNVYWSWVKRVSAGRSGAYSTSFARSRIRSSPFLIVTEEPDEFVVKDLCRCKRSTLIDRTKTCPVCLLLGVRMHGKMKRIGILRMHHVVQQRKKYLQRIIRCHRALRKV